MLHLLRRLRARPTLVLWGVDQAGLKKANSTVKTHKNTHTQGVGGHTTTQRQFSSHSTTHTLSLFISFNLSSKFLHENHHYFLVAHNRIFHSKCPFSSLLAWRLRLVLVFFFQIHTLLKVYIYIIVFCPFSLLYTHPRAR